MDIARHYDMDRVLSNFGIRVVGQVETAENLPGLDESIAPFPEAPDFIGEYGDAYAVGAKAEVDAGTASYTYYVFSRPGANTGYTYGYWLDVGRLAIVGPQGIQGEVGPQGPQGYTPVWYTAANTPPTGTFNEGDICIINGTNSPNYGNMYKYQRGVWQYIASVVGPRGPVGPQGERGPMGPTGPKGDRGVMGPAGQYLTIAGLRASADQLPDPNAVADRRSAYLIGATAPYELWAIVPNEQGVLEWRQVGYSSPTVNTNNLVTLNTSQEITGSKTFTNAVYFGNQDNAFIQGGTFGNNIPLLDISTVGGTGYVNLSNGTANITLTDQNEVTMDGPVGLKAFSTYDGNYLLEIDRNTQTTNVQGLWRVTAADRNTTDPTDTNFTTGMEGQVLASNNNNVHWSNLKTINGESIVGEGDLRLVPEEVGPEFVKTFNFYPQTAGATATTNGEGTITVNGAGSNQFVIITADTENYSSYNVRYQGSINVWQYIFYTKGTEVYSFRFMSNTELRIQRFNYTTFSGGLVTTIPLSGAVTITAASQIEMKYEGNLVSLYIDGALIATYDMTSLVSDAGKNVSGLVTSYASGTNVNLITNWLVGATPAPELVIDTELNVDSSNPIANSAVARKFEEYTPTDNRVKYSHFSIDDFYLAFEDLTTNTPASIFDNATFAWLKTFHETTGCTISCYCFYQNAASNPTFTLDMVPTTWRTEFQANSDWLKFGFHALYSGINYASATAETATEAYSKTITALINITGSAECIDKMPRLHNFAGSLEACKAMRDAPCGCCGFLAAINASDGGIRQSYYLDEEFNTYINKHDYLFDPSTQLHFVRTQEGGNLYNTGSYNTSITYANVNKFVEFFTHENQLTDGLKSSLIASYNRLKVTHKPVFWQNIFN